MAQITDFGKTVKKKLIDFERSQQWLIERVKAQTGLYFDGSYLYKILIGRAASPKIVKAICEILSIE